VFEEGDHAGLVRPEFGRLALLFWQPLLEAQTSLAGDTEEVGS